MGRDTRFQKGRQKTGGRTPSIKTQLKRFEERHPEAYDALMEMLYEKGLEGSSIDAQYVIDRLKGKPKAVVGLDREDKELLTIATILEFRKMMDTNVLKEGEYAIQGQIEGQGSPQGDDEEEA